MNELQIRLTADIAQFQAQMAKAEDRLERAQTILKTASVSADKYRGALATLASQLSKGTISQEQFDQKAEKLSNGLLKQQDIVSNSVREVARLSTEIKRLEGTQLKKNTDQFKRQEGIIEGLTRKAKNLNVALSQATSERDIIKYNLRLEETGKELQRIRSLGQSTSGGVKQLSGSVKGLTTNLTGANGVAIEFSRIIQDAPFGLIGIGNNIQQLTANYANLRKQTSSTGAAVKASLSALISPANLLVLAVSAITAGFTAYQMGAFDFMKSNEKAKKSIKELADEIENSQSKTAAESANIQALRTVIEDETLSRDKRFNAIDRLQKKYPEIFANVDKEKLLNGQLIGSYDLLTKAIIQRAEASLAEQTIPQLNKEKQAVDNQINSLKEKLKVEQDILDNTKEGVRVNVGTSFSGPDPRAIAAGKVSVLSKELRELESASKGLQINIDGYAQAIVSYQEEFVNLLEPVKEETEKAGKGLDELKDTYADFFNGVLSISDEDILSKAVRNLQTELDSGKVEPINIDVQFKAEETDTFIGQFLKQIEGRINSLDEFQTALKDAGITSADFFKGISDGAFKGLDQYDGFIEKFIQTNKLIEDANKIIETSIENTIGDVASAIGGALANGGNILEAGGQALLGGISAVLGQLGQLAIATGIAIGGIKKALMTLNPVVAIAAGVALIGLAGFVGSKAKSIGGGMGGGASGGGGGAVPSGPPPIPQNFGNNFSGVSSPSTGNVGGRSIGSQRLEATVTGDQIRFVLDQSNRRRGRG